MTIKIELPDTLIPVLKNPRDIFLSVNPIFAFSDVLMSLDECIQGYGETSDVLSMEKFKESSANNKHAKIVVCGNMLLREIPFSLCAAGIKSTSPWLLLRVNISNTGKYTYNYLDSSSIEDSNISLNDESWGNIPVSNFRFNQAQKSYSKHNISGSSNIENSELEFLE